ncbi:P-loop containing nucleoside triphosphate hydrolase protein [Rhizoclosmatium globosum]|uniref:p-loop containing nucleoside triphosphate hydrolase protein n=1 Tax=Rhizoclosmatium globosum TaxID=329046 RepID=A0A1Y2CW16_9FUNG|nr:P-loop containing nucleoside triphosphate hydrolase protein [Rhizoclosmatium globosum]|eukprot:ORY51096.1 P-loop containing nucleoside triphosphate hydrolase protein [Rhizoclosmatium globosum]
MVVLQSSWYYTRIQFITAIYKKCMRLSISHTSSSGYIVNLVANDVNRFEEAANFFLFLGIAPLMLVVIGNAAFVASFVTLLVIPVQLWVSKMFGVYRRACVEPRDARLKYISDMLNGIMMNIDGLRKNEVKNMMKASILRAINLAFYQTFSCFIELFAFGSYHLMGGTLTPSKVYTTIVLLQSLKWNMGLRFPMGLQFSIESLVSFQRIQKFLMLPEIETTSTNVTDESLDPSIVLQLQNASFNWPVSPLATPSETKKQDAKFQATEEEAQTSREILKNISLTLRKSQMAVVIGPVGSGKSSLLNAVLREMECHEGSLYTPRNLRIAYASQTPWILSGTIRENILFGSKLDIEKLRRVIYACALEKDIELFEYGLDSLVGERGASLSGGQKARLALARACYSDSDLLLLDDPLSAVDAKVGRHLYNEQGKVLVTHQLQYVIGADHVLLLENGEVTASGSYEAVMNTASSFSTVMKEFTERKDEEAEGDEDAPDVIKKAGKPKNVENGAATAKVETTEAIETQFVKEEAAKGTVALKVYRDYFRAGASWFSIGILLLAMAAGNILLIMTDWWVGQWAAQADQNAPKWGWAFLGFTIVTLFVVVGRSLMFFTICITSSWKLSQDIVQSVFGAEMRRMSSDLNRVDENLPWTLFDFVVATLTALSTIILACSLLPIVLIIIPPMGFIFYKIRQLYIITSRQVKREEAITPTIEGLSTVRAFRVQERFIETFIELQNKNTRIAILYISISRWLGLRSDVIGALFLTLVVFATVGVSRVSSLQLSGSNVGLILTYSLNLVGSLQWAFRQSTEVENLMTQLNVFWNTHGFRRSLERRSLFAGEIEFKNLSLRYPPSEKNVLKDISVKIPAGSTVGIVGRNLRFNLDPTSTHTDDELWSALSSVQLEKTVSSLPGKLDAFVSENGGNWSVGERQLICLARAILKKSRVFVMDEATSAVDLNTDSLIAKVLRDKGGVFYGATTLTIAHRLNTIIDYNYVMVLDQGELVEFGVPHELLQKDTGEEGQRVLSKMALDAYNERKN